MEPPPCRLQGACSTSGATPAGGAESTRAPEPSGLAGGARRGGALDRAVAVRRDVGLVRRGEILVGAVEAALELAEHDAEQEVAPGRLRQRAVVPGQLWQVVPARVVAVRHER